MKKNLISLLGRLSVLVGLSSCTNKNPSISVSVSSGLSQSEATTLFSKYCETHPAYKGTEDEWLTALFDGSLAQSYKTSYNIIFTIATIPPVLSALDSIRNGNETYAFIERGKTYSGIDSVDSFHNLGFDIKSNKSDGFTADNFQAVSNTISKLNVFGNEHFNIYLQDGNGLYGSYFAANSMLSDNQYDVYRIEDGTGSYDAFQDKIIGSKTTTKQKDEIYDDYKKNVDLVRKEVDSIKKRNDNPFKGYYDIAKAFYLSAIDNYHYWLQDSSQLRASLENTVHDGVYTKLFDAMGCDKGHRDEVKDYKANLKFETISDGVASLDPEKKQDYLKLRYGSYYSDTYSTLTRTSLKDGTSVPSHKLVYIGTRFRGFPAFASSKEFGIGGAVSSRDIPEDYASLDSKYKTEFLFETEADYKLFIDEIKDDANYDALPTEEQRDLVKVQAFNQYINYIFALKYAQKIYGKDYDLVIKGHPSEVIDNYQNWTAHYLVTDSSKKTFQYDKLVNKLMVNFHSKDSSGKFVGRVPYGTAAENLAYLGVDRSICGLPSSTYAGYDTSVPVLYVRSNTDGDIRTDGNLSTRYTNGTLDYSDISGEKKTTSFVNNGNVLKNLAYYYGQSGKTDLSAKYTKMFKDWMVKTFSEVTEENADKFTINEQGILVSLNS